MPKKIADRRKNRFSPAEMPFEAYMRKYHKNIIADYHRDFMETIMRNNMEPLTEETIKQFKDNLKELKDENKGNKKTD